jgi:hypothetical protein
MTAHRLKVTNPGAFGHQTVVELDGLDVSGALRGFDLNVSVSDLNTARLFLSAPAFEVEGEYRVALDEDSQALLKRLGWTPPEETP